MESKEEILESLLNHAEERAEEELGEKYAEPARLLKRKLITGKRSDFFEFWDSLRDLDEDEQICRKFLAWSFLSH